MNSGCLHTLIKSVSVLGSWLERFCFFLRISHALGKVLFNFFASPYFRRINECVYEYVFSSAYHTKHQQHFFSNFGLLNWLSFETWLLK